MQELKERFEKVWESFMTSYEGTLISESKKDGISFQEAKISLNNCLEMWYDSADICGHWLNKLTKTDNERGEKVKDVLVDIELHPIDKKPISGAFSGAGAAGAAAIGFATSKAFELGTIGTVASTVIPAAVAYPVVSSIIKKSNAKKTEEAITGYVDQLDQYKRMILAIIE